MPEPECARRDDRGDPELHLTDAAELSAEDLYENAPCGYLSAAPDGRIVRVNGTFLRWTGYTREALVDVKRFQDLLTAGGRIYHETHYAPLLRMQGSVREIAVDIVAADGRRLPVLVNSVLHTDEQGRPQVVRTTLFDATERKAYERELLTARNRERAARERIERLQRITAAVAAAPDAAAIVAAVSEELTGAFGAADGGVGEPVSPAALVEGQLWLEFAEPRELEPEERDFLIAAARQTALALDRARLHEETRTIAHTLQHSLITVAAPRDPRYAVATLYQPAGERLEVGGDWHDAFELPGGKLGIVVGDVVGRGLSAATAMGQLRSAVRALGVAGHGPAMVTEHLDAFVARHEAAQYATLAYAEVDPDSGDVAFTAAGHLPPILTVPGAPPEVYMGGRTTPLGVRSPSLPRVQATFTLAPGEGFLLYTDGLIERRGERIDTGIERLLATLSPGTAPQDLVDALIEDGSGEDDVCVLMFSRTPR